MAEMVMINVTPEIKKLVEDLSHASGLSQKAVVEVIFATLDGRDDDIDLAADKFKAQIARFNVAKAKAALAEAEAEVTKLSQATPPPVTSQKPPVTA